VSGPRIGNELRLLAGEAEPLLGFGALHRLGLDTAIAPGFGIAEGEPAASALRLLPPDASAEVLILAVASLALSAASARELLDRLAFQAAERDAIIAAVQGAERLSRDLGRASTPAEIGIAIGASGPESVALAGALGPVPAARRWLVELRGMRLQIDGSDLLAAGLPEGPAIGAALAAARAAMWDGLATGREQQLKVALDAA
jgi:tRNA nucleotidyltransferase (CCA-adding enzyme)